MEKAFSLAEKQGEEKQQDFGKRPNSFSVSIPSVQGGQTVKPLSDELHGDTGTDMDMDDGALPDVNVRTVESRNLIMSGSLVWILTMLQKMCIIKAECIILPNSEYSCVLVSQSSNIDLQLLNSNIITLLVVDSKCAPQYRHLLDLKLHIKPQRRRFAFTLLSIPEWIFTVEVTW